MTLTKEQRIAVKRIYDRDPNGSPTYRHFRRRILLGCDCLMINWCGMWLGIETNGYTHS